MKSSADSTVRVSAGEVNASDARRGVLYGIAAYGAWGVAPVYFKLVADVPVLEVLAHRIVWSILILVVLIASKRQWSRVASAVRSRKTMLVLLGTTVLISFNWFMFIYCVSSGQILQASLGYFINPLVNVLLGFVFLKERLRPWQILSVALAAGAVTWLTVVLGEAPTMALALAGTFGVYGLLRKIAPVDSLIGLTVETAIVTPIALAYLVFLGMQGTGSFGRVSIGFDVLLAFAGCMTAFPLLWFTNAARRLRLATLGFLQYLAPTGHFLLAVLVYDEPFDVRKLVGFAGIWAALAIYSADAVKAQQAARRAKRVVVATDVPKGERPEPSLAPATAPGEAE